MEKPVVTPPPPLTCTLPEVLNQAGDACEIPIPVCTLPEVLNEAQDACIDPIADVGWISDDDTDTCDGMRQATFDPNVYFARSGTNIMSTSYPIPQGYRWLTKAEYSTLLDNNFAAGTVLVYHGQCGQSGYPQANGYNQTIWLFKNNGTNGFHSGNHENMAITHSGYSGNLNFAGYVLYKEN